MTHQLCVLLGSWREGRDWQHLGEEWGEDKQGCQCHHNAGVEVVDVEEEGCIGNNHEEGGRNIKGEEVEVIPPNKPYVHLHCWELPIKIYFHVQLTWNKENTYDKLLFLDIHFAC